MKLGFGIPIVLGASIFLFQNCSPGFDTEFSGGPFEFFSLGSPAKSSHFNSISRFEMLYAAQDLLQDQTLTPELIRELPVDAKVSGFESAGTQNYDESFVKGRMVFAELIADRAVRSFTVFACQPSVQTATPWDGCIRETLLNFATRAYRRPLTANEEKRLRSLYESHQLNVATELSHYTSQAVHGHLDSVSSSGLASGWALDPVWHLRPVEVHFYLDAPAGVGRLYGSTFSFSSRPDVNQYYASEGYFGNYGYHFQLGPDLIDGKVHKIYAYSIGGGNRLLGTREFQMTSKGTYLPNAPVLSTLTKEALKNVFVSILTTPAFQLRGLSQTGLSPEKRRQFEIANKISWYIGSTVPDTTTLSLAAAGSLTNPEVYKKELSRLMEKYAERFSFNVIGQWLGFRDYALRPDLTDLEKSMIQESILVFKEVLARNLPLNSILEPGFTYATPQLAKHYGIPIPVSPGFSRIEQSERGGVLTQGSILTLTAPNGNTKPIVRGKWLQWNLLCKTIPSPTPEMFQEIAEVQKQADPSWSVSERLEHHRNAGPSCFTCHQHMDPLGLALENFGALGVWRQNYPDGKPVISAGVLDGVKFDGVRELTQLVKNRDDFKKCVVTKLLTHALSRPLDMYDLAVVNEIASKRSTLRSIVESIAMTPAFLRSIEVNP